MGGAVLNRGGGGGGGVGWGGVGWGGGDGGAVAKAVARTGGLPLPAGWNRPALGIWLLRLSCLDITPRMHGLLSSSLSLTRFRCRLIEKSTQAKMPLRMPVESRSGHSETDGATGSCCPFELGGACPV